MPVMSNFKVELPYEIKEVQHVIPIRCGDSRDSGAMENEIMRSLIIEYAARGIKVDLSRLNIAGAVVNKQSYIEIKDLIKGNLRQCLNEIGEKMTVDPHEKGKILHSSIVQISAHADIALKTKELKLLYKPDEVEIVDNHSTVNCGMSDASEVWKELIALFYELKPEVKFYDKQEKKEIITKLDNDKTLLRLLKSTYAHEGDTVESFITSIDLLKEPQKSNLYLRSMFDADNELARVPIHINYGIINYRTGLKIRMDENAQIHTVLDDLASMMRYVMDALPANNLEKIRRGSVQKPIAGLICSPDIPNPREALVRYLRTKEKREGLDVAGTVFLTTGMNVTSPFSSFGPYKLGGIAYSIVKLHIRDYYIIGNNSRETLNIRRKVENDPILNLVMKHFKVKMRLITLDELKALGVQTHTSAAGPEEVKAIKEAIAKFKRLPGSALNKPIIAPDVLKLLD
ncbi:hypothetical protein HY988_06945 [Candidatus Micrarchaeota archaeon]|nr:hypothetical protein [Candidatus Micrarchaeota archaeon]